MNRRSARASKRTVRVAILLVLLVSLGAGAPRSARGGGGAAPAPPAESCRDAAVQAIQRRYEAVRDIEARFEQTTRSVALGGSPRAAIPSRGQVVFAKPGRMRWTYESPEPSLVVSDGHTLWVYDPSHREVQRLPVGEGYLSGAAIQFLLGEGDMANAFRITELSCGPDAVELELVPREPATYEKLRVLANRETGELLRTTVVDLLGNTTEVAFHDVRVNQDPADAVFTFEVPDGVKVMELESPGASGP